MDLMKWDKDTPENFYVSITHLWMQFEDGHVEVAIRNAYDGDGNHVEAYDLDEPYVAIHADVWGEDAYATPQRGYYSPEHALVSCHGRCSLDLVRQLARKFKDACYIQATIDE